MTCHIEGCGNLTRGGFGLCGRHYQRWVKWGDPYWLERHPNAGLKCRENDCPRPAVTLGRCHTHDQAWRRRNVPGYKARQNIATHRSKVLRTREGRLGEYELTYAADRAAARVEWLEEFRNQDAAVITLPIRGLHIGGGRGMAIAQENCKWWIEGMLQLIHAIENAKPPSPGTTTIAKAAHEAVHVALAEGELTRETCEVCGSVDTQAHHDDYAEPLMVRWLCRKHHSAHHVAARKVPA